MNNFIIKELNTENIKKEIDYIGYDNTYSNFAKDKFFTGIVLYTGEHVIPFGESMLAVPMNNLWD